MSHYLHELTEARSRTSATNRRRDGYATVRADIERVFALLQPMTANERAAIVSAYTAGFKLGAALAVPDPERREREAWNSGEAITLTIHGDMPHLGGVK